MSFLQSYEFVVLQYVHDLVAGEAINVGVAIFAPKSNYVSAKCRHSGGRLVALYPSFDVEFFKSNMKQISSQFCRYDTELNFSKFSSIEDFAFSVLPKDDGGLVWTKVFTGVTKDPKKELEKLYARYVSRHDSKNLRERRTELDVWKSFKKELDVKKISACFVEKTISVRDDEINFKYAWKNGIWHCVQPLSFDLSSSDNIKEKAHKWYGQISSVSQERDDFKVYLVIAKPTESDLYPAYSSAISILNKMPGKKEIVFEENSHELVERFASQIESHNSQ